MSPVPTLPDPITPREAALMAEVAHELRTPLNAVLGFADILRAELHGPLDDRYAACADLIHEAGRHMLALIGDLQDLALTETGRQPLRLEAIDAREPVLSALRLVHAQFADKGVALQDVLPADPMPLRADARALTQIALNLLANALKFTPRGGAATLTLAKVDGGLALTVTDTGVGFAASPPRGSNGMGLGLALVRALTQAHGGALTIDDSPPGQGARVGVWLPTAGA